MDLNKDISDVELSTIDEDLFLLFSKIGGERYVHGLPTKIQTARLLKKINQNLDLLIDILKVRNQNSNARSDH